MPMTGGFSAKLCSLLGRIALRAYEYRLPHNSTGVGVREQEMFVLDTLSPRHYFYPKAASNKITKRADMNKFGGGTLILVGIAMIVFGFLLRSPITDFLVDLLGLIAIIAGVVVGVIGVLNYLGSKQRA